MPESVRYQRFVLRFESPWNYGLENVHEWSVKFSTSGAVNCPQPDMEATALDFAFPIFQLTSGNTSLISWDHYPIGSATHDFGMSYIPGTHKGSAAAYNVPKQACQLEVCVLAECPVGVSGKGRPVFLRKWIHDVFSSTADPNTIAPVALDSNTYFNWDNGCGPHKLVPVSPSSGIQGGPWAHETHLFTHQLRRGPKKKVAASSGGLGGDLTTAIEIAKLLAAAGSAAP